jgi:PadR family transcriptional regulator, regulatory protein PadR
VPIYVPGVTLGTSRKTQEEFRRVVDNSELPSRLYPPAFALDSLFTNPQERHTPGCLTTYLLLSQRKCVILPVGNQNGGAMKQKTDVLQGTLALMVLKTLDVLGSLHGYGIARRIEQISGDLLAVNQGTLYPVLLKLEQEGAIASDWGASENNRRARFYRLTKEGRKQLQVETQDWEQTAAIIGRFFEVKAEDLS